MALLLAPAGSPEALRAAIAAGADEVYLGGGRFNARAGARNFTHEQLVAAGQSCRDAKVRLLYTLNTLLFDRELSDVLEEVAFLQKEVAPDAYIVQDLGLAKRMKERFPEVVLHASTQMRIHSSAGGRLLKQMGFSRVVLAREMAKEDIASFVQNAGVESEVFIHGALCVCESGGCLLSAMIGRRSGNRGECAQPCRLPYRGKEPYPLSLKDNCLAAYVNQLADLGVGALKIEGRMKSPDYVYTVTSCYRRLLDEKRLPTEAEIQTLQHTFSRSGFTAGYYEKRVNDEMFGVRREEDIRHSEDIRRSEDIRHPEDIRLSALPKRSSAPEPETPLPFSLPEKDPARLLSPKEQLGYVARFEGAFPRSFAPFADAARIDLPLWRLEKADISGLEETVSAILPRVVFDREEADVRRLLEKAWSRGVRRVTIPGLSLLPMAEKFRLHGDYPLNVSNRETLHVLEGYSFSSLFLSPEAEQDSFGFTPMALETLGYGRLPLMHTETCLVRRVRGTCEKQGKQPCQAMLTDRVGACFPVIRTYGHRTLLYNSLPTYRLDKRKALRKGGVGLLTLLFTVENEGEMLRIRERFLASASPEGLVFTRR
ncbi:MAG: U32 family peptidase [Oscillospiraceae bacterium]|nr:U32 family peptidase [Oscillospiraceae bacterium]